MCHAIAPKLLDAVRPSCKVVLFHSPIQQHVHMGIRFTIFIRRRFRDPNVMKIKRVGGWSMNFFNVLDAVVIFPSGFKRAANSAIHFDFVTV